MENSSVEEMYQILENHIIDICTKHTPVRTRTTNKYRIPNKRLALIRRKKQLNAKINHRKFVRENFPENLIQKLEKKKADAVPEPTDKKVARLLQEGKSLGEIQHTIQMQKPYYIQAEIEEKKRVENEEKKEMDEFMKNPLKDETQELIDSYANAIEERTRHQDEL
jgi:hypothetical protein